MKFLLISNSNLAEEMYHAMQNFYTKPDIDFITLSNRTSNDFAIKLKTYLANTSEEITQPVWYLKMDKPATVDELHRFIYEDIEPDSAEKYLVP